MDGLRGAVAVPALILAWTWLVSLPAGALAQPVVPERREAPVEVEGLTVTATREERQSFEVPDAVTLIEKKTIEQRSPKTLPELLRGETGVYVQSPSPSRGNIVIRGHSGRENLKLVDGMRFNNVVSQNFGLIDPYNVERIEVVRESSSTLYGSDAIGGVINFITPVPRFTEDEWQARGRALGQFGSADTSWVNRLSVEGGRRGLGASAGFTYQNYDDLRGGRDTGVQKPSGFDVYAGDAKLFLERGNQDVLFSFQYLQQPKTARFDELVPGFGETRPGAAVAFFEPSERLFLHGRYRVYEPLPFVERLQFNVAYQEITDDRRTRDFGSAQENREENRGQMIGITLQLTSRWQEWMTFTYGGEIYLERIDSSRIARNINTGALSVQRSRLADGSSFDSFGVFVQDEIRLHPRLTAILGGRFSYFDVDVPAADRGVGTRLKISDVTGSLGLIYHLTPSVNLVTNVGRGFQVPDPSDLSNLGPAGGNRFNVPNPDLDPQQVVTVDAGAKVNLPRFAGDLFGFYSDFTDKIESVPTGARTSDGRIIVQNVNLTRVEVFGVEAGARWNLTDHLDLIGALTYTWGREETLEGRTTPASRMPPLNGRLSVFYRPLPALWVEPFMRFATSQHRLSDSDRRDVRINPKGTPGWVTANFRAGWDITRNVQTRLTVENLLDHDYREHGAGINAPGINAIVALDIRLP